MFAQLQELQKQQQQQQLGQLGDVKPQSSLNNLSLFGNQAPGGQTPNLSSGMALNSSEMFTAVNMNWMHRNVSLPMQGSSGGTSYSHDQGLMVNPSFQHPDVSLYGTPVATGRSDLEQYSLSRGVSHSSINIPQVSPLANSFLGDKHAVPFLDGSFMQRQGLQGKGSPGNSLQVESLRNNMSLLEYNRTHTQPGCISDSRETAKLDPLEKKILFDTEDSGWDSSLSKLAAIGTEELVSTSGLTEFTSPLPSIQSGSWSALMQSAVAEASSSDTGVQEELSGLSFQNTELSSDNQPSNSIMSSAFPSFRQTGLQLAFEQGVNKPSSDITIEQQPHISQLSESQQQIKQSVPVGHLRNNWFSQSNQNSKSSAQVQNISSGNEYMPMTGASVDEKENKVMGYDSGQLSNSPMLVDAPNKKAAQMCESQNCYQGENFGESYNSKVSQTYVAQPDQPCLNAEDSESSAKSSQKSRNQALCISSPGANSQQECFSSLKSSNVFSTKTSSIIKGKQNLLADALSKGSPVSDISASSGSQYTSELNKANWPRDYRSSSGLDSAVSQTEFQELDVQKVSVSEEMPIPDAFSFQSVLGDSSHGRLGTGQRGQTWWMPLSFGHFVPPSQGASVTQDWRVKSSIFGSSGFDTSNLNSERSSHEAVFSSLYSKNQMEGAGGSNVSVAPDSIKKRYPKTDQQMRPQDSYLLKNVGTSGFQYSTSGALPITQSFSSGTYQQGMKPHNVWMNVSSERDVMAACKGSSNVYLSSIPSNLYKEDQLGKEGSHEQKSPMTQALKVHVSMGNAPLLSGDVSTYLANFMNQKGHIKQTNRSFTGTSSRAIEACDQPQHPHVYEENVQQELNSSISINVTETDMSKVDVNSSQAVSNLNVHRRSDVFGQQRLGEAHMLASNPVGSQLGATSPSALEYIHSPMVPVFGESIPQGHSNGNNMVYDRIRNLNIRAQMAPAWYKQYEYIKNGQMLSLSDAAVVTPKPSVTFQLSGTHVNAMERSKDYGGLNPANQNVINGGLLSSSVLPPDAGNMNLALSNPKKRKTAMYDSLPWHMEVIQTCRELQEISIAEQEWAEATNRLIEKRVDEGVLHEEMRPAVRAKKRLLLTTQLMQQVFRPPAPTILLVDAASEYEIVAYSVAKLALADACSLTNKTRTDCHTPHDTHDMSRNAWSSGNLSLVKAAEELVKRVKTLESCVDGLDRSLSVKDVRVECQELEKLCVINHFAKYHTRVVHSTTTDTASSSTTVATSRPFLQRYVNAVPLPRKLPEATPCLSL